MLIQNRSACIHSIAVCCCFPLFLKLELYLFHTPHRKCDLFALQFSSYFWNGVRIRKIIHCFIYRLCIPAHSSQMCERVRARTWQVSRRHAVTVRATVKVWNIRLQRVVDAFNGIPIRFIYVSNGTVSRAGSRNSLTSLHVPRVSSVSRVAGPHILTKHRARTTVEWNGNCFIVCFLRILWIYANL